VPESRILALADLHLSGSGEKPMDIFGEAWKDHGARIAREWDARVRDEDTVLLPGDLSWAKTLADAAPDLRWIAERPGRKLLLRGNHDSWWSGIGRVRAALPPGLEALHLDAHRAGGVVVVGARGWTLPEDPLSTPHDEAIYRRELERLRLSLKDADRRFGAALPRLAMTHYPPCLDGGGDTEVTSILRDGGVGLCVFGHLHGPDHARAPSGLRGGVRFRLVAADAVGFAPVDLTEDLSPRG
jgi:predicted phosphohydrolase